MKPPSTPMETISSHFHHTKWPPAQNPLIQSSPHSGCATLRNTAGPGQIPCNPHPMPNIAAPTTNFQSISFTVLFGRLNLSPKHGGLVKPLVMFCIKFGSTPNIITRSIDGSQASRLGNAKNERSFDGWDIFEMSSPSPKVRPERNCVVCRAGEFGSHLVYCGVRYATMGGTSCAVAIAIAARKRSEAVVAWEG